MSPEEEIVRAGEARQILGSRMFKDACANIEEQLATMRRSVPIKDTDMQSRIILMEHMYVLLTSWFQQIVDTGKMADITLRQREQQRYLSELNLKAFHEMGRNAVY